MSGEAQVLVSTLFLFIAIPSALYSTLYIFMAYHTIKQFSFTYFREHYSLTKILVSLIITIFSTIMFLHY